MKAIDFIYDGLYLSDFGCIICTFDGSSISTISEGSKITFNKTSVSGGRNQFLSSTKYDECIEADFQICKNPKYFSNDADKYFTNDEKREIIRWLNRESFHEFSLVDNYEEQFYYDGSFNVDKIDMDGHTIGLQLHFVSSKPYATSKETVRRFSVLSNQSFKMRDSSDAIGYSLLDAEITLRESGNLRISNSMYDYDTVIKNCSVGETITIKNMIIESSSSVHQRTIMNDFNFRFPKIFNTFKKRDNTFTFSLSCDGKFSYKPIRKVGL